MSKFNFFIMHHRQNEIYNWCINLAGLVLSFIRLNPLVKKNNSFSLCSKYGLGFWRAAKHNEGQQSIYIRDGWSIDFLPRTNDIDWKPVLRQRKQRVGWMMGHGGRMEMNYGERKRKFFKKQEGQFGKKFDAAQKSKWRIASVHFILRVALHALTVSILFI